MAYLDPEQLNQELNASFSALTEGLGLSVAVTYQHMAAAADLGDDWVAEKLTELALTIERELPHSAKPQFAIAYIEMIRRLAAQFSNSPAGGPSLTLIAGGKRGDDDDS